MLKTQSRNKCLSLIVKSEYLPKGEESKIKCDSNQGICAQSMSLLMSISQNISP